MEDTRTDGDLLRAGDRESLDALFARHRGQVYQAARRILRNDADAHDAVQAAFLSALRALPALRDAAKFPGWLRRIGVNAALALRRSRAVRSEAERREALPAGEGGPRPEDVEVLKRALDDLPEDYRLPIILHHGEGMSYDEIARLLDWPRGTVGTNIHRGLERLRAALAPVLALSADALLALLGAMAPPPPDGPSTALA